jgi:hypothetical protein
MTLFSSWQLRYYTYLLGLHASIGANGKRGVSDDQPDREDTCANHDLCHRLLAPDTMQASALPCHVEQALWLLLHCAWRRRRAQEVIANLEWHDKHAPRIIA